MGSTPITQALTAHVASATGFHYRRERGDDTCFDQGDVGLTQRNDETVGKDCTNGRADARGLAIHAGPMGCRKEALLSAARRLCESLGEAIELPNGPPAGVTAHGWQHAERQDWSAPAMVTECSAIARPDM